MHPSLLVRFYLSQQIQTSFICTFKDKIVTSFDKFPALCLQMIGLFLTLKLMFTLELTLLVKIMFNKLTQENTDVRRIHRI